MKLDLSRKIFKHLQVVVGEASSSGGLALQDSLKALDAIVREQGDELDPELRHYLEKRSYQKARLFFDKTGA